MCFPKYLFYFSMKLLQNARSMAVSGLFAISSLVSAQSPAPAAPAGGGGASDVCKFASNDENLLTIVDGDKQNFIGYRVAQEEANTSGGSAVASWFTWGLIPAQGTISAVIGGATSSNRIKSRTPVFPDLTAPSGMSPDDAFYLVKLVSREGRRAVVFGKTSTGWISYNEKIEFPPGVNIPLNLKRTVASCTLRGERWSIFEGTPRAPLAPGEYAIVFGESFYDFTVE
jgi:hypothetical protein